MPEFLFRDAHFSDKHDNRTVSVVWTTGQAVRRRDRNGEYDEILSLDPSHVNLSRLIGAPLLDSHRVLGSVKHVIGVVESAEIGTAKIRFAKNEKVEPIYQNVLDGILRQVSIGYKVDEWQDVTTDENVRQMKAVKWTPYEISLVAVGADAGAQIKRGFDNDILDRLDRIESELQKMKSNQFNIIKLFSEVKTSWN